MPARHAAARSVNARMTASYWEIGRRIVGAAQKGRRRMEYGDPLIARLSSDLTARFGRGFSADNRENMRRFYLVSPPLSRGFRDAVSETRGRLTLQEFPDSVWEIGSRRTGAGPHAAVVGLRAAAVGQRRSCPPVCTDGDVDLRFAVATVFGASSVRVPKPIGLRGKPPADGVAEGSARIQHT